MYGMHRGGGRMGPRGGMGGPRMGMHGGMHHRPPVNGFQRGMYGRMHDPMWGHMWHRPVFYRRGGFFGGMGFGGGLILLLIVYALFRGLIFL